MTTMKLLMVIDAEEDAGGGSVGIREAISAVVEPLAAVRFIAPLPMGRVVEGSGDGLRYAGEGEYIPCDKRGKCLDGDVCPDCAYADILKRLHQYETACAPLSEVTADARKRGKSNG